MNLGPLPFVAGVFVLGLAMLLLRGPLGRHAHRTYSTSGPRSWARTEGYWTTFTVVCALLVWAVALVLFVVLVLG